MVAKAKQQAKYTAMLKNVGVYYFGEGATLEEAVNSIQIRNPKGAGVLTIKKGDQEQIRVFSAPQMNQIFSFKGMFREKAVKNAIARFSL